MLDEASASSLRVHCDRVLGLQTPKSDIAEVSLWKVRSFEITPLQYLTPVGIRVLRSLFAANHGGHETHHERFIRLVFRGDFKRARYLTSVQGVSNHSGRVLCGGGTKAG